MHSEQVMVVGPPSGSGPLCSSLRRAGLAAVPLDPNRALRQPGWLTDAALAVFVGRPGTHPTLEAEAYVESIGAVHVSWDDSAAEVGPFVAPGAGPCPRCLASSRRQGPGTDPGLEAWATSWAALQAAAILGGCTDLVGASWAWRLASPGLGLVAWRARPECTVASCRQP